MNFRIKAFWWKGSGNNFGDVIAPKIIQRLSNTEVEFSTSSGSLCSIGSVALMNYKNPMEFWGSGVICKTERNTKIVNNLYHCVRGPLSRERIIKNGGYAPEIYGDPGLLIPYLFDNKEEKKNYDFSFLPHYVDYKKAKSMIGDKKIHLINILQKEEDVIKQVKQSKFVICSSLHAFILAESYNIPCCLMKLGNGLRGGMFKFEDYYNSTNRELVFIDKTNSVEIDLKQCEKSYLNTNKPQIKLRPMLDSFPFEIKNKNILEKFYEV